MSHDIIAPFWTYFVILLIPAGYMEFSTWKAKRRKS